MTDPFFDLGKDLPQVSAESLVAHLRDNAEIFERAFIPSSVLEATETGDTLVFKGKTFKRMRFYETRFVRVVFNSCTFDECLLLGAHFEDCEFHRCAFIRCNTNKFHLTRTYLDPRAFLEGIFDARKYSNVGVNLFQTLLKNSIAESQPDFRDVAEYHFRRWQRYVREHYWRTATGRSRWLDIKFYAYWVWSVTYQHLFGFGVRARHLMLWTPILFLLVWQYNFRNWPHFGVDPRKLATISVVTKSAFFTVGNLSTFGTSDLIPTTTFGLLTVSIQVILGIGWIALSTAMLVRRFIR